MNFGQRLRDLRKARNLSLRGLAGKIGVSFTYISKVENGKLESTQFPSEPLIRNLATALDADVDELLLLAQKIPEQIKGRVLQRPDAFRKIARLDDDALNKLLEGLDDG